MMRIKQKQQGIVDDSVTPSVHLIDGIPGQAEAEATGLRVVPIFAGHLFAVGPKPGEVFDRGAEYLPPLKKMAAPQDGVLIKDSNEPLGKS